MWRYLFAVLMLLTLLKILSYQSCLTQNLKVQFLNVLGGLIPWSSQYSLVMKSIEKAITCFNAWVASKHSEVELFF